MKILLLLLLPPPPPPPLPSPLPLPGNRKEKQAQRPRTRNAENVADENQSDPYGCWCAWYSKKGMVENIKKVPDSTQVFVIMA